MKNLSKQAKIYILLTMALGAGLTTWHLANISWRGVWIPILVGLATLAQILKVEGATEKSSYNVSWLVYGFTFVTLGASATIFVILIAHLVEWGWYKYSWYIQLFNIAAYSVAISAAALIYQMVNPGQNLLSLAGTLGILASLAGFTFVNHLLVGTVIWTARGENYSQSGIFGFLTLAIDFTLISLGACTALIWMVSPSAAIFTLIPLYLIYSTLQVPALQRKTKLDAKTGLFNARYFVESLEKELTRAERYDRPVTVVIGDLDLLRNINNTYGHLAGDTVLIGVAEILQKNFRGYDIVARFGGEEFSIMMPETTPEQAYARIESVRQKIETAEFEISTSITTIKVTMSFGIAGRDEYGQSASDTIHNADVALYHAKLNGRNLTNLYSGEYYNSFLSTYKPAPPKDEDSFQARLDLSQTPFRPNPIRQKAAIQTPQLQNTPISISKPAPHWLVNTYVWTVMVAAVSLAGILLWSASTPDWIGLAIFTLIVLITEGLSVEIYIKNSSVSTSAAPLIAGSILFGPIGGIVLSIVLAATAMLKKRSPILRFIFNASNHLISSMLGIGIVRFSGLAIGDHSILFQFSIIAVTAVMVYLASTLLLSGVISLSSGEAYWALWKVRFRWLWAYFLALGLVSFALVLIFDIAGVIGVIAILVPLLMLRFSQHQYIQHTKSNVSQLRTKNIELESYAGEITSLNEELLTVMAQIIDTRDPYTMGHSKYVSSYAAKIAKEMGLSPERQGLLQKAGLLHDIGKLGIPEKILLKPGLLTDEEHSTIKLHPTLGADIVTTCHTLQNLIPLIRYHHERIDGQGYPEGLRGQEIPLGARILAVVDAVDAMASDRPYRKGMDFHAILKELDANTGTQFDPAVVAAFKDVINREGEDLVVNSAHTFNQHETEYAAASPILNEVTFFPPD